MTAKVYKIREATWYNEYSLKSLCRVLYKSVNKLRQLNCNLSMVNCLLLELFLNKSALKRKRESEFNTLNA